MSHAPSSLRRFVVFVSLCSLPLSLLAQSWIGGTDSNFSTGANWSTGTAPGSSGVAMFGASQFSSIDFNGIGIGTLQFTNAAGPYVFNLNTSATFTFGNSGSGVINASAFQQTFNIGQSSNLKLVAGSSLGNSIVNLGADGSTATLTLINGGSVGTSTVMIGSNATLSFSGGAFDGSGGRFILDGGRITENANGATLLLGSIEGTGHIQPGALGLTVGALNTDTTFAGTFTTLSTFTKIGSGTLTLTGANSIANTLVTGGAIALASNDRLSSGSGTLTLNGGALRYDAAFDNLRAVTLGASGGTLDTQGYSVTHSTGISGTGALTKAGSGTLTLAAANTYSGDTHLATGTLAVGDDAALGTGTLQLDGGTLTGSGAAHTFANAVSFNADTTLGGSQDLTFTGAWTLTKNRDLTVANSALTTISGAIGESGGTRSLAKYGSGTLVLTGANTYTGGTLIAEGTVKINNSTGSAFGSGAVTVADGATLTGAGHFSGAFQNNGTYSPGNSPVLATLSSFNQGSTGVLEIQIGGLVRGTEYDALNVTGALTFDGQLDVTLLNGFLPASGASFNLFDWDAASGTFATVNLPDLGPGLAWDTSSLYTTGELDVVTSAIPEPSTYAIMSGLGALFFAVRRRRAVAFLPLKP